VTKPVPRRLLFVCAGNICRSPMARFLAERMAREAGLPWSAASAGLAALVGEPMTPAAARALSARGVAGARHSARALDEKALAAADAVYAMTRAQRDEIAARFPARAAKALVLREAAGLPDPDVADPYGGTDAAYEECASRIEEALKVLIRRSPHAEHSR
jgi:protein-tyrosine phosphatase